MLRLLKHKKRLMKHAFALAGLVASSCFIFPVRADIFGSGDNQFSVEFVAIGNSGNAADTATSLGTVDYSYFMGQFEVSRDMINKANAEGGLGIAMQNMNEYGGNEPNRPATGVAWNAAARFVNWLNTSQGYPPAYKFAIQPGEPGYSSNHDISLWVPGDSGYDSENLFRNSLARYVLPSNDEWYKAAYYDPGVGEYFDFPTGSDSAPTAVASGTLAGTAVYGQSQLPGSSPADVTLAGGLSPYGTMAQGGNALEFVETEPDRLNDTVSNGRVARGGGFYDGPAEGLKSTTESAMGPPSGSFNFTGFRVASLAETDYRLTVEYLTPDVTGPLIAGWDPLPATITATFRLNKLLPRQTIIGLDQVQAFSFKAPGLNPTVSDLDHFQLALDNNGSPLSLNWGFAEPKVIITNNNFTLEITGTDPDTEEAFRYFWSESTNTFVYAIAGDFDLDGDVDGRDFLVWQRNPSVSDLADWQANYGGGSLMGEIVVVPEPTTRVLLFLGGVSGWWWGLIRSGWHGYAQTQRSPNPTGSLD